MNRGRDLAVWSVALQSVCVAVEREDLGSSPARGGRFLSTESTCVLTLDGVPLTPMSSHCWHVKEPYHSARVQVMGSGRPTQSQERKQYVCALGVAPSVSLTQVRHSPRSELALIVRVR